MHNIINGLMAVNTAKFLQASITDFSIEMKVSSLLCKKSKLTYVSNSIEMNKLQ